MTSLLSPQELDDHRARIGIEVEASLQNGGHWVAPSSKAVKAKMFKKWMDALQNYGMEEIEAAFTRHALDLPSKKPNEGRIVEFIVAARKVAVASLPKERAPEAQEPSADEKARVSAVTEKYLAKRPRLRRPVIWKPTR